MDGVSVLEGDADTIGFTYGTANGFVRVGATTSSDSTDDVFIDDVAVMSDTTYTARSNPLIGCIP